MGNALNCAVDRNTHDEDDSDAQDEVLSPLPPNSDIGKSKRYQHDRLPPRSPARSREYSHQSSSYAESTDLQKSSSPQHAIEMCRHLEKGVPLRCSRLWNIQRRFYVKCGSTCWSTLQVPCFQTSNAFIAYSIAKVVATFLRDWFIEGEGAKDLSQPIYILEVGSGHGKFSYLFLNALLQMEAFLPRLDDGRHAFVHVISDISSLSLSFIENHPSLAPFFEAGIAEVTLLDAEDPDGTGQIFLRKSRKTVDLENMHTPVVAICNYVIDSLVTDAFRIVDGCINELLVSISSSDLGDCEGSEGRSGVSQQQPSIVSEASVGTSTLDRSITNSCATPPSHPTPIEVITSMDGLQVEWSLSTVGMNAEEVRQIYDSNFGLPDKSNAADFTSILQEYLTDPEDTFKCMAILRGMNDNDVQETTLAWEEAFVPFGPDTFTVLHQTVKETVLEPSPKLISALLRLGRMDPDVYYKFHSILLSHANTNQLSLVTIANLKTISHEIVKQVYPLHYMKDVFFEVARLLMALKDYDEALKLFQHSQKLFGSGYVTHHNLGICRYNLGEYDLALQNFTASLKLRPDFEEAVQWKAYCEQIRVKRNRSRTVV